MTDTCLQPRVKLRTLARAPGDGAVHVLHEPLDDVARVAPVSAGLTPGEPGAEHAEPRVLVVVGDAVRVGPGAPAPRPHVHQAHRASRQGLL